MILVRESWLHSIFAIITGHVCQHIFYYLTFKYWLWHNEIK